MPRRQPAARPDERAGRSAGCRLSADDLDELLTQAKVPKGERAACARHINELFRWYRGRLLGNEQTEARATESMRRVADAARELYKALASLPPTLRMDVEPDCQAFLAKIKAILAIETQAAAHAAAAAGLVPDPEAQRFADQLADHIRLASFGLGAPPPLVMPLPLEHILAALIETTEKRRLEFEAQVSREWSSRRRTFARNELARNLKAIIMGCSPKLANDERAAEGWVASVLEAARIRYPRRETNLRAFKAMLAPGDASR
jgi:hypothetical protein